MDRITSAMFGLFRQVSSPTGGARGELEGTGSSVVKQCSGFVVSAEFSTRKRYDFSAQGFGHLGGKRGVCRLNTNPHSRVETVRRAKRIGAKTRLRFRLV